MLNEKIEPELQEKTILEKTTEDMRLAVEAHTHVSVASAPEDDRLKRLELEACYGQSINRKLIFKPGLSIRRQLHVLLTNFGAWKNLPRSKLMNLTF